MRWILSTINSITRKFEYLLSSLRLANALRRDVASTFAPMEMRNILYAASYRNYSSFLSYLEQSPHTTIADYLGAESVEMSLTAIQVDKMQPLLRKLFGGALQCQDARNSTEIRSALFWGAKLGKIDMLCARVMQNRAKAAFIEDGFLRSVVGGLLPAEEEAYRSSISLVIDDLAPHYDGNHQSRVERLILGTTGLSREREDRVHEFINFLKRHNLTKYNYQPICRNLRIGEASEKVLVILQSHGDASVDITGGNEAVFKRMLSDALEENPDADILIKTHPDTLIKRNRNYLKTTGSGRVYVIDFDVNPVSLLGYVGMVYVYSSQMGLEALLLGKKVVVYGKPCYAGWGLTDDRSSIERRGVSRTLPELFDAVYFQYSNYFDPETGKRATAEEASTRLLDLRRKYFEEKKRSRHVLIIKLDGIGDYILFRNYMREMKNSPCYSEAKFTLLGDRGFKECAETLDSDFFERFFWVDRRGNRLLSALIAYAKRLEGIKALNRISRKLLEGYVRHLCRAITGLQFDTLVVSAWSQNLESHVTDTIACAIKARMKIARAGYPHSSARHGKIFNYQVPVIVPEWKTFRGDVERQMFENIVERDLSDVHPGISLSEFTQKSRKLIVFFVGAYHPKRRWPLSKFAQLAALTVKHFDFEVHVCGDFKERKTFGSWPAGVIDFTGKRPFRELMEKFATARLVVTNDTGFYHMAVAMEKDVVVLSNGNSYHSFLKYPEKRNIEYVFPRDVRDVIASNDEKKMREMSIWSEYDIGGIDVDDVFVVIQRYLSSDATSAPERISSVSSTQRIVS